MHHIFAVKKKNTILVCVSTEFIEKQLLVG